MDLNTRIDIIAQHIYQRFYQAPYPSGEAREFHGMKHVTRAMLFGTLAYRLMFNHTNEIDPENLKLVQIALLLHDSGRQADGPDLWDRESCENIKQYLIDILQVEPSRARGIATAMLEKDSRRRMDDSEDDKIRLAIQFGDCLDIYRVRGQYFDTDYLTFYQSQIKGETPVADLIERFLPECLNLIDEMEKMDCEDADALNTLNDLKQRYPIISTIEKYQGAISELKIENSASADPIVQAFHDLKILYRGVEGSSKPYDLKGYGDLHPSYSFADHEIRKTLRRPGIPTRTQKINNTQKNGNPLRSATLIGPNTQVFTEVGGAFILNNAAIVEAHPHNIGSGRGKKNRYFPTLLDEKALNDSLRKVREHIRFGWNGEKHNEIVTHIDHWDCIIYCCQNDDESVNDRLLILAGHLRETYRAQTSALGDETLLPVYMFSRTKEKFEKVELIEDRLAQAFKRLFESYMRATVFNAREVDLILAQKIPHEQYIQLYTQTKDSLALQSFSPHFKNMLTRDTQLNGIFDIFRREVNAYDGFPIINEYDEIEPAQIDDDDVSHMFEMFLKKAQFGLDCSQAEGLISWLLRLTQSDPTHPCLDMWLEYLHRVGRVSESYRDLVSIEVELWFDMELEENFDASAAHVYFKATGLLNEPLKTQALERYMNMISSMITTCDNSCQALDLTRKLSRIRMTAYYSVDIRNKVIDSIRQHRKDIFVRCADEMLDLEMNHQVDDLFEFYIGCNHFDENNDRIKKLRLKVLLLSRQNPNEQGAFFIIYSSKIRAIFTDRKRTGISSDSTLIYLGPVAQTRNAQIARLTDILSMHQGASTMQLRKMNQLIDEMLAELTVDLDPAASSAPQQRPKSPV